MYWLIPYCSGRILSKRLNKLALIQGYTWAVGMSIMSGAMHFIGLFGAPRRSDYSEYGGAEQAKEWIAYQAVQAVGGTLLFLSILLVLYICIHLAFFAPKGQEVFPVSEAFDRDEKVYPLVENWKFLIVVTIALILIASVSYTHLTLPTTPYV